MEKLMSATSVIVQSIHFSFKTTLNYLFIDKIVDYIPTNYFSIENWDIPNKIHLADPTFNIPSKNEKRKRERHDKEKDQPEFKTDEKQSKKKENEKEKDPDETINCIVRNDESISRFLFCNVHIYTYVQDFDAIYVMYVCTI